MEVRRGQPASRTHSALPALPLIHVIDRSPAVVDLATGTQQPQFSEEKQPCVTSATFRL